MFKAPEEYWYLHCLSRWEKTAPPDSHQGVKVSGQIEENTQTARVAYLLKMVDNGNGKTFRRLEERTQRKDGRSYISKDRSWMRQPYELNRGWYLEGNMSLHDKQTLLKHLPVIGAVSLAFVSCAEDFVAGKSVQKYWPADNEVNRRQLDEWIKAAESD